MHGKSFTIFRSNIWAILSCSRKCFNVVEFKKKKHSCIWMLLQNFLRVNIHICEGSGSCEWVVMALNSDPQNTSQCFVDSFKIAFLFFTPKSRCEIRISLVYWLKWSRNGDKESRKIDVPSVDLDLELEGTIGRSSGLYLNHSTGWANEDVSTRRELLLHTTWSGHWGVLFQFHIKTGSLAKVQFLCINSL